MKKNWRLLIAAICILVSFALGYGLADKLGVTSGGEPSRWQFGLFMGLLAAVPLLGDEIYRRWFR